MKRRWMPGWNDVGFSGGAKEPVKEEISEIRKTISNAQMDKMLRIQLENSLIKVENELEFLN